jgi:hypothetical protein
MPWIQEADAEPNLSKTRRYRQVEEIGNRSKYTSTISVQVVAENLYNFALSTKGLKVR